MLSWRPNDRTAVHKNMVGDADWPKIRVTTTLFPSRLVMRYRTGCVHMMGIDRTAICVFMPTSKGPAPKKGHSLKTGREPPYLLFHYGFPYVY